MVARLSLKDSEVRPRKLVITALPCTINQSATGASFLSFSKTPTSSRLTHIATVTMVDSLRGLRWLLGTAATRSRNPQSAKSSIHIDRTSMVRSKTTKGARAFSRSTRLGASSEHATNSGSFALQNELPRHIRRMATVQHSKGVTYSRVVLRLKQT